MEYSSDCQPIRAPLMPLIINSSLQNPSFTDYLGSGFKIKESSRTPRDSVILPCCGVAALLIYLPKVDIASSQHQPITEQKETQEKLTDLLERMNQFHRNHQCSIMLIVSPVFNEDVINFISSTLIMELLPRPPYFLIAHGDAQAASHITLIAKATTANSKKLIKSRVDESIKNSLNDVNFKLTKSMGLSSHASSVLLDNFASFEEIIQASADEIHRRTPLDKEVAEAINDFLNKDSVI